MTTYPLDTKKQARRLRAHKLSYTEIAKELGVPPSSVRRWCDPEFAEKERAQARAYKARQPREPCTRCGRLKGYTNKDDLCIRCVTRTQRKWTEKRIIAAIKLWAKEHGGKPPISKDWTKADPEGRYPTYSSVYRGRAGSTAPFATWADAIEAAGFPRPLVGHKTTRRSSLLPKGKVSASKPKNLDDALQRIREYRAKHGEWPRSGAMIGTAVVLHRLKIPWDEALRLVQKDNPLAA